MVNPSSGESTHQASVLYSMKVPTFLPPNCVVRHTCISFTRSPAESKLSQNGRRQGDYQSSSCDDIHRWQPRIDARLTSERLVEYPDV